MEAKMNILDILRKKRDGEKLSEQEIKWAIDEYTAGEIRDYQAAALLMAVFIRGLDEHELWAWTSAMLESGKKVDLSHLSGPKVDKHSTGGVGDKISIPLAPLTAALGINVPMISGRGLGHTGGTLDKLESIPGFRTGLSIGDFVKTIQDVGVAMIGQTAELAPADRKIYALRDVTSTVESIPLICASIMSKKLAEGIDGLVLDVKTGSGAFMKTLDDSRQLAHTLVGIGKSAGVRTVALITDMNQPLGRAVGNAMEIRESIDVLKGRGPRDVVELTVTLAGYMMYAGGLVSDAGQGMERAREALADGRALAKFRQMVLAQHGDPRVIDDEGLMPIAEHRFDVAAEKSGFVTAIDTVALGMATVLLGGGRLSKEDAIDPAVGLEVLKKPGDPVKAGDNLVTIHYNADARLQTAIEMIRAAYIIGDTRPDTPPLVYEVIE